jgi:hypothetical protein
MRSSNWLRRGGEAVKLILYKDKLGRARRIADYTPTLVGIDETSEALRMMLEKYSELKSEDLGNNTYHLREH